MTSLRERRVWRQMLLGAFLGLLAGPTLAGEFRLFLEGEAGVRDGDGRFDDEDQVVSVREEEPLGRVGLNLQLSYLLERMNLALNYSPSYERSLDDSELSGTTHRLDFGVSGELTRRLRMHARERLQQTPDLDPYEPVASPDTTALSRQGDQLSHNFDLALDHAVSRRSSVNLGLGHSLRTYESDGLFDSETLGARIGASWELLRGQTIGVGAGASRFDYEERGESDVLTLGVTYATDLGRDSRLQLDGGIWSVDSTRPSLIPPPVEEIPGEEPLEPVDVQESQEGWRGGIHFSQDRELFRWAVGLRHDISAGAGLGRTVEADNAFVGISTQVGRQWTFGLDGNASRQTDISETVFPNEVDEDDTLTEFIAGTARASWSFSPAFRLSGGYSRVWQDSGVAAFEDLSYSRYFLSLAFRIYSTGETPTEPDNVGRPVDDEQPDAQ